MCYFLAKLGRATFGANFSQTHLGSMITIFSDFRQFSAKNGVYLKHQCCGQIFAQFSFVLSQKCQFFSQSFWRKYFKNHNIGP
jgi:hypothetical protein